MRSFCYIDIETSSGVDIKNGVAGYVNDSNFRIIAIGYAIDDKPVKVVLTTGLGRAPDLPKELSCFGGVFVAHNWFFDYSVLAAAYKKGAFLDWRRWLCTAALSRYAAVDTVGKLSTVATRLGLAEKLSDGQRLIDTYSMPKSQGLFSEISNEDKDAWARYVSRDVELTREIFKSLFPIWPEFEKAVWQAHKQIALRGIPVDTESATSIVKAVGELKLKAEKEAEKIAGRTAGGALTITSNNEFRTYVLQKFGVDLPNVQDLTLSAAVSKSGNAEFARVVELRRILNSRATDKAELILKYQHNGRVYDPYVYCGASTGRWASWGVNFNNFSRESVAEEEYEKILKKINNIESAKSLIRGLVCAPPGHVLIISDWRSIELHLLLFLVKDKEQLDILESGRSLYTFFGEKVFGKGNANKGSKNYSIAKSAVLGLGYGAGANVFAKLAGIDTKLSERVSKLWRQHNKRIVDFWAEVEAKFKRVANNPFGCEERIAGRFTIYHSNKNAYIELPNGFRLYYRFVEIDNNGNVSCSWDCGVTRTRIWGAMLVENLIQSLCRQLLAAALADFYRTDIEVIMHVYDEIVCCVPEGKADSAKKRIADIMTTERPWLPGFKPMVEQHISKRWLK